MFFLTLIALLSVSPDDHAYELGKEIRCPVCQGMPISESPAQMAQDMMKQVRHMVIENKSDEEIKKYFTDRYGDWVLLNPKPEGFNLFVWIVPPVLLLLGGFIILRYVRKHR
jgi:cytochrome c-type biogenesis protein CcmH